MNPSESVYTARFCALDLETTGVNAYSERIIEIGAVMFTSAGVESEYHTLVNPARHIP
ncbi:MAG: 3'-5' exonuclease, partial [Spirochaetota bacterium]